MPRETLAPAHTVTTQTAVVARAGRAPVPGMRRRPMLRLALALALGLAVAGLAAIEFDHAFHAALRPVTAVDEASAVCAYLRSQDYTALAAEMDPAPGGTRTGRFDAAQFVAALRARDRRDGPVQTCALRRVGATAGGKGMIFALVVYRARVIDPLESLVVVQRGADDRWMIERASTFYDAPV